jgi:dihydropteroate synthase
MTLFSSPVDSLSPPSQSLRRPSIELMAILNCTPDSFSDGGRFNSGGGLNLAVLLEAAQTAVTDGASILDIGGESTRPGAQAISLEEEIQRVLPAVELLRRHLPHIPLSVDTRKTEVARQALMAGAAIINDVSGLQAEPGLAACVAAWPQARLVIMHSQGSPETMQDNPYYPQDVVSEALAFFERQGTFALQAGVRREQLILDPGFGFGKTRAHNFSLLKNLSRFTVLGLPLLVGLSRKSFLAPELSPVARDDVSIVAAAYAIREGAQYLRVHNVAASTAATRFAQEIALEESV